jgi:hypothetical protein
MKIVSECCSLRRSAKVTPVFKWSCESAMNVKVCKSWMNFGNVTGGELRRHKAGRNFHQGAPSNEILMFWGISPLVPKFR